MSNYSILFPGQGSQSIGMMDTFAEIDIVRQTFAEASKILEKNLWSMISIENTDIHKTENTQPIMLTAGIAIWRLLREKSQINPSFLAGHSLGEFTALVAADAIDFNEALKLVTKRAELMQEAVPEGLGAMAAIIGLDDEKVIELCRNNKSSEVIDPVNFNSPGQVVIAGHKSILEN
jgi:[acyl-carrier-protein] S-malonyltransferase